MVAQGGVAMSDLIWLSEAQMRRIEPHCGKPDRLMIDATHLKAHRTAASLLKKGLFPDVSGEPRAV
jgi:hypothetical protein